MFPTPDEVKALIGAGIATSHLAVVGDGQHFEAVIVSAAFEGKRLVQRHQIVNQVLGSKMGNEIHALSMKTLTPAEWAAQSNT
jgi:acid stress-induced BolA-like protein IbaG/YrbA